jgi:uncharacterized membrane protein YgcG
VLAKLIILGILGLSVMTYVFSFNDNVYTGNALPSPKYYLKGDLKHEDSQCVTDVRAALGFNYTCDSNPYQGHVMWLTYNKPAANFITFFYWVIIGCGILFLWFVTVMDIKTIRGDRNKIFMPSAKRTRLLKRHLMGPPAPKKTQTESSKNLVDADEPLYDEFVKENPIVTRFLCKGYMRCFGNIPFACFFAIRWLVKGQDGHRGFGIFNACTTSRGRTKSLNNSDDLGATSAPAAGGGGSSDRACYCRTVAALCSAIGAVLMAPCIRTITAGWIRGVCNYVKKDFGEFWKNAGDNIVRIIVFLIVFPVALVLSLVLNILQLVATFGAIFFALIGSIFVTIGFCIGCLLVFAYVGVGYLLAFVVFVFTGFFCFVVLPLPMILAYCVMSLFFPTTVCKLNTIILLFALMFVTFILGCVSGILLLFDWLALDFTSFIGLDPLSENIATTSCVVVCSYPVKNVKLYAIAVTAFAAFLKAAQLWTEARYCDGEHSLVSVAYRVPFDKAREFRPGNPAMDLFDMTEKKEDNEERSSRANSVRQPQPEARIELEAAPAPLSERMAPPQAPPMLSDAPAPLSDYAASNSGSDTSYGGGYGGGDSSSSSGYGGGDASASSGYGGDSSGGYGGDSGGGDSGYGAPPPAPPM